MTHFHPGDRVLIIGSEGPHDRHIGEVATVVSDGKLMQNTVTDDLATVYAVDIEVPLEVQLLAALKGTTGVCAAYRAEHLKKLDDDGDEREVTEWDDCVFKPKELVTIQ